MNEEHSHTQQTIYETRLLIAQSRKDVIRIENNLRQDAQKHQVMLENIKRTWQYIKRLGKIR